MPCSSAMFARDKKKSICNKFLQTVSASHALLICPAKLTSCSQSPVTCITWPQSHQHTLVYGTVEGKVCQQ